MWKLREKNLFTFSVSYYIMDLEGVWYFMDKQKIDIYSTTNSKYFQPCAIPIVRGKLKKADENNL